MKLENKIINKTKNINNKNKLTATKSSNNIEIAIIMGSNSDYKTMIHCEKIIQQFDVSYQIKIISAHRTPDRMFDFAKNAQKNGIKIIIAAAGGAAHLPGMVASLTNLPVLGVPIESKILRGQDSLLSIVQMPAGIPVGTLAIGEAGAKNAALLALQILAINNQEIAKKVDIFRQNQTSSIDIYPSIDDK
jgi:5-(carboxyamino)imidazole ribonucleotide mutase